MVLLAHVAKQSYFCFNDSRPKLHTFYTCFKTSEHRRHIFVFYKEQFDLLTGAPLNAMVFKHRQHVFFFV